MTIGSAKLASIARSLPERLGKDPRLTARVVLGLLLVANLVAAAAVFRPWGGSAEGLQQQLAQLRRDQQQRQAAVERLRTLVGTVEKTRTEVDRFFDRYFLDGQTVYSTVLAELNGMAEKAGVKAKGHTFNAELIEGSNTLGMMTVTGYYEGTYADLVELVNAIDRSPRFLTIDRLQAAPLQTQGTLNVNLRLNVFVRGEARSK